MEIQVRLVAKLVYAAERVEEAFEMPPLKERKPKPAAAVQSDSLDRKSS